MICNNCREKPFNDTIRHKYCYNDWAEDPEDSACLIKRDIPLNGCFCQHRENAKYTVDIDNSKENEGNNGDGS